MARLQLCARYTWRSVLSLVLSSTQVSALAICSAQAPLGAQQPAVSLAPNVIYNPAGRVFETTTEGYSGSTTLIITVSPSGTEPGRVIVEVPTATPTITTIFDGYSGLVPTTITINPNPRSGEQETIIIETPTIPQPSGTTTVYQGYSGAASTSFTLSPNPRGGEETVVIETPTSIGPPFPETTTIFTGYSGLVTSTLTIYPNAQTGQETVLIETPTSLPPSATTTLYQGYPGSIRTTVTRSPNAAGGEETVIVETPLSPTFPSTSEDRAGYITQSKIYTDSSTITANFYTTIAYATGTTSGTVEYEQQFTGSYTAVTISDAAVFSTRTAFPSDERGTATLSVLVQPTSEPQIQFTTITDFYPGSVTSLTTIYPSNGGSVGTIEFLTPGGTTPAPSITSQPASGIVTTYVTGGSVFGTTTVTPSRSGTPTTVEILCPTPDQSCDNVGLQYAIYNNTTPGSGDGYPSYNPDTYKTQQPIMSGQTQQVYINISSAPYVIYNVTYNTSLLASEHVGFFYACRSGQYLLQVPNADDVTMLWVGQKAFQNWTRNNTDIQQFYGINNTPDTISVFLNAGEYLPVRLSWANAGKPGTEEFSVIDPDGLVVVDSSIESPFLIHHSCDGTIICFPAFGSEP